MSLDLQCGNQRSLANWSLSPSRSSHKDGPKKQLVLLASQPN